MKQLLDLIHAANPDLPQFAFGHSLGSPLTQWHIQNWGTALKGAVLSGTFGSFSRHERLSTRHEPLNDFCREQMHSDVVGWLDRQLGETG
jgi:hypothetical protein